MLNPSLIPLLYPQKWKTFPCHHLARSLDCFLHNVRSRSTFIMLYTYGTTIVLCFIKHTETLANNLSLLRMLIINAKKCEVMHLGNILNRVILEIL